MAQRKINLAEGRLDMSPPTQQESTDGFTKKNSDYGVGRLGLTSVMEQEETEEVQQVESTPEHKTFAFQADAAVRAEGTPEEEQPHDQAEAAEMETQPQASLAGENLLSRIIARRNWKKVALILTAALGVPVVVGLIVINWHSADNGVAPQVASAGDRTTGAGRNGSSNVTQKPPSPQTAQMQQPPPPAFANAAIVLTRVAFRQTLKSLIRLKRHNENPEHDRPAHPPVRVAPPPKIDPARLAAAKKARAEKRKQLAKALAACRAKIRLTGIMKGPKGPVAIINKRFVKVGQTVNDVKVVRIRDFSVEVELDGQRFLIGISSSASQ